MKTETTTSLKKTLFNIRFKPYLEFFENKFKIGSNLKEFPHWETNYLYLIFKDFDNRCSIKLDSQLMVYEQDKSDLDLENKYIEKLIDIYKKEYNSQASGLYYTRRYLVEPKIKFQDLVNILNIKLYSSDEQLKKILPQKTLDLMYRKDFKLDNEDTLFLTLGATRKNEIPMYILFNSKNHFPPDKMQSEISKLNESYPDQALFINIDYQRINDQIKKENIDTFYPTAVKFIEDLVMSLKTHLFKTKL
jgi:hypothetical protein